MASTLDLLEAPFIFSQNSPLRIREVIKAAERYRIRLDSQALGRLHERNILSPMACVTDDVVRRPADTINDPTVIDSTWSDLRAAQYDGRIFDPADPTPPTRSDGQPTTSLPLRFGHATTSDPPNWWNGLLYSRWQLLDPNWWRKHAKPAEQVAGDVSPDYLDYERQQAANHRQLAVAVTVLEARYLPQIHPGVTNLRNIETAEWYRWATTYDPEAQLDQLDLDATDLVAMAEGALTRARHLDPSGRWAPLIGRANPRTWEHLRGDLAASIDLRVAAEILLLCHDDLQKKQTTPALVPAPVPAHHPLQDRLSSRTKPLDRLLSGLGISPHPGAMLLIEGASERRHVPRIFDHLELTGSPDLVQVLPMNGVDKGLELLAVATAAPLLGERTRSGYEMLRPPCRIIIAVDPEGVWRAPESTERQRRRLVDEITRAVLAQAPDVDTSELDSLVEVTRWDGGTFEYTHFTDDELLQAITTVHTNAATRPTDDAISALLAVGRLRGRDIKHVWHDWDYQPSKVDLADALWPALRNRIDQAVDTGAPLPQIAEVALNAYNTALGYNRGSWLLPAQPPNGHETKPRP